MSLARAPGAKESSGPGVFAYSDCDEFFVGVVGGPQRKLLESHWLLVHIRVYHEFSKTKKKKRLLTPDLISAFSDSSLQSLRVQFDSVCTKAK